MFFARIAKGILCADANLWESAPVGNVFRVLVLFFRITNVIFTTSALQMRKEDVKIKSDN